MNKLVPGYFSRENAAGVLSNGSCCGNDTASERSMVRKFIVDSVNYWADEYHIDGFRFDLVGLIDVQTIDEIIRTVRQKHPHCIFYGEGWNMKTEVTKPNVPLAVQGSAGRLPSSMTPCGIHCEALCLTTTCRATSPVNQWTAPICWNASRGGCPGAATPARLSIMSPAMITIPSTTELPRHCLRLTQQSWRGAADSPQPSPC